MISSDVERINYLLKKANFETFFLRNFSKKSIKFCFDLLVKKDESIFNVKVFPNIDNLNPEVIRDIKILSHLLKSKPLLIGIKNRYQKLEDNTIYERKGLPFITVNTLEMILKDNSFPHILARRGGGVVFLNGSLMKKIREKHEITRKELSERLGVTKRTVSAYEQESMRPSEEMAMKILKILKNRDLFKKINIFEWNIKLNLVDKEISEVKELSEFEAHLQTIIDDIGLSYYWNKKGSIPFKLSLFSSINQIEKNNFYPLFSAITDEQNKINKVEFECLKMFNDIFNKTALYIIDNNIRIPLVIKNNDIHIVKIKKLEEVDNEEEFIELIQES
ncbi:hypothetical protein LCGC14_1039690 [marine sediment metagenome]|uniref:HTH cro/C1-type domain-containing protein n=1 Tax=marine sediment metagenome TaxID=412755 RepID=A0A0F9MWM3_9ZZZZ|nr:helix-turn-helix domain-containing protein [archaeon]